MGTSGWSSPGMSSPSRRAIRSALKASSNSTPQRVQKAVDLDFVEAIQEGDKKPTLGIHPGIYALDKDHLKLCVAMPDTEAGRPKEFSGAAGTRHCLITLKREKN